MSIIFGITRKNCYICKMKGNKEYILCAAIWYKGLELSHEDVLRKRGYSPYNIDEGIVLCGWRHTNIIYQMKCLTNKNTPSRPHIQGFLTNTNRFVDRTEAVEIAYKAGQTEELLKTLYSEDLY